MTGDQLSLLDTPRQNPERAVMLWPPASASRDPVTSHIAESKHTKSGKRRTQAEQVLVALKQHPGSTAGELSRDSGLNYHMISRRLTDLRVNKLAQIVGIRQCATGRGPCQVWNPMEAI